MHKYPHKGVMWGHRCRVFKDRYTGKWAVKCINRDTYCPVQFKKHSIALWTAYNHVKTITSNHW